VRQTYRGSCHCGAVRFEVQLDLAEPTFRCNCSICRRTRFWAAVAKQEDFQLLEGEAELHKYRFHTGNNHHFFCRHCGVRPFGVGNDTPIGPMVGVNVGCLDLDDEAMAAIPVRRIDGRHDRMDAPAHGGYL
jgi:hypothetical protein